MSAFITKNVKYITWPDFIHGVEIPRELLNDCGRPKSFEDAKKIVILSVESHQGGFNYGVPKIVIPHLLSLRAPVRRATHKFCPRVKSVLIAPA